MKDLSRLSEVNWASLRYPYGPGSGGVPRRLRALADGDTNALAAITDAVVHQGMRYESAAAAVPYLVWIVFHRVRSYRVKLLCLLDGIAVGYDDGWLPDGFDLAVFDHAAGLRDEDREWAISAYRAVAGEAVTLAALLDDEDPAVRTITAHLLGWFPGKADTLGPRLLDRLAGETDISARTTMLIAYGLLAGPAGGPVPPPVAAALDDDDRVVRTGAAIACARLGDASTGRRAVPVLAAAIVAEDLLTDDHVIWYMEGNLRGYAALALAGLDPDALVDAVVAAMPTIHPYQGGAHADAITQAAFPDGPPAAGTPFRKLTPRQRRAVAGFVAAGFGWSPDGRKTNLRIVEPLGRLGLPVGRDELAAYVNRPAGFRLRPRRRSGA